MGVVFSKINAETARKAGNFIELFLIIMLFFVFFDVNIKDITKSFKNLKFSIPALTINFLWTPVFAYSLGIIFFPSQTSLQIGFIMLMVTPCTDWYLIFTRLAKGNVTLGSSILPLNLILQIILMPVYLFIFMKESINFDAKIIMQTIIFTLILPLTAANIIKGINFHCITNFISKHSGNFQFILLCVAVAAMFASQGEAITGNLIIFAKLFLPVMIFFTAVFLLSFFTGKKLGLSFRDTTSLIFTTSARNSPVALAIAIIAFPSNPVISLILVIGPLIELPVLAIEAVILSKKA
ncbi:MAG: bile acid:sodium symporter [Spirochaetaceae bacterium]|nr:bile acid:sodium symporter [Spirochaetaceae bacterium]